jgi:hypothetical protein
MQFLQWLEHTGLGTWVREQRGLYAYPLILFLHTLGMGCLVGASAVIDLRILGFARDLPLSQMDRFFRVAWFGFWVNAVTGTLLLIADATTKLTSPVFYIKMTCIFVAVIVMVKTRNTTRGSDDRVLVAGRILAVTSLLFWAAAITAGRLMAYVGPVTGLQSR